MWYNEWLNGCLHHSQQCSILQVKDVSDERGNTPEGTTLLWLPRRQELRFDEHTCDDISQAQTTLTKESLGTRRAASQHH